MELKPHVGGYGVNIGNIGNIDEIQSDFHKKEEIEKGIYSNERIGKEVGFKGLGTTEEIAAMQRIAARQGVTVVVLSNEGEDYTHVIFDPRTGKEHHFRGVVPNGQVYVSVSPTSERKDLDDFWKALNAEKASPQNPSGPPKKI